MIDLKKIDHIVITTKNIRECVSFYKKIGFIAKDAVTHWELYAGDFKINVHIEEKELEPKARFVQPGSADICIEVNGSIENVKRELEERGILLETNIVMRHGAKGSMHSIYLRDSDENLIELSSYE
ncbi:MAG: hypothetical protein RR766_03865 [Longicatena sp.]